MKAAHYIAVVILALVMGMAGAALVGRHDTVQTVETETAFARVMRTRTLRCGYASWAPMIIIDGNTKQISGVAHDIIEAIAKKIDLKVEWVEESGWGEFAQALNNKRFDAYCEGLFSTTQRESVIAFTHPFAYSKMNLWTQGSNTKFDNNLVLINDPATRVVVIDGTTAAAMAHRGFPNASFISLPELTPVSNLYLELSGNKADITIMEAASAGDFMKQNPGQIKLVEGGDGYRVLPNKFAVAEGEYALQQLLNTGIEELNSEGILDEILAQYEPFPGSYYRVAKPYQPLEANK